MAKTVKASVVIPTKNAGAAFASVLDAVLGQEAPWSFEVLVVDSGSSDATVRISRDKGVRVHEIAPGEFGHGKTRNLGISLTAGEFAVLITHDALPVDAHWLHNLVKAAEQRADVAGAFGRHLPYASANPFVVRDLTRHFDGFKAWPLVSRADDPERYERDQGYRQVLHFFSDNNACIRRSVWEKYPYPDVDFAEDQIWAKTVIEAGYAKAYADDARVYHSHDYGVVDTLRRSYDESRALFRLFGYELGGGVPQLLKQSARCTARDVRDALFAFDFRWAARAPALNVARQLGYFIGTRAARDGTPLYDAISLDRAKRRSAS